MTAKELRDILDRYPDDAEVYVDCIGDRDLSTIEDYYTDSWGRPVFKVSRIAPLLAEIGQIKRLIGED